MENRAPAFQASMLKQELPFAFTGLLILGFYLYEALGLSPHFFALIIFSVFLLFLSAIDIRRGMIYNRFLAPMAGTGVLLDFMGLMTHPLDGILAAIAGGLFLLLIRWVSRGGMGGGDVKLGFVLGLWLGLPKLTAALFLAFLLGSSVGILLVFCQRNPHLRIPFGPFLSLGAWLAALHGDMLIYFYEVLP